MFAIGNTENVLKKVGSITHNHITKDKLLLIFIFGGERISPPVCFFLCVQISN